MRGMMRGSLIMRHGDIGERPERRERHRAGLVGQQRFDDEIDAVLRFDLQFRQRQVGAVHAGFAMHMLGGDEGAAHGALAAGIDGNILAARELDDLERIAGVLGQRDVAGHRDDAEDIEIGGRGERHEDGDGIVLARVGVDNDLAP